MTNNNISIFIPNLLNWEGTKLITGGLERYILALAELVTEMGYNLSFYQNAHFDFINTSLNWPVYGYKADPYDLSQTAQRMEKEVYGRVLYSSIVQQTYYRPGSICISHGVWWEVPGSSPTQAKRYYESHLRSALEQTSMIISCDYNFLNVSRAIYPDLTDQKVRVIPNFADLSYFYPRQTEEINKNNHRLRILYPRRLSPERGFGILKEVIPGILSDFPYIEFQFAIDTNHSHYLRLFHEWRTNQQNQDRILYCHPDFHAMPDVYAQADIIVIPSCYSEGTSLSCIEAMAMGKAIIATNIGGLTNLILNGYNGLLIHPSVLSLSQAIRSLIKDPELRTRLGHYAYTTAQAFNRKIWENLWRQCISKIYPL